MDMVVVIYVHVLPGILELTVKHLTHVLTINVKMAQHLKPMETHVTVYVRNSILEPTVKLIIIHAETIHV